MPAEWNEPIIEEFRANGGKVGGPFEGVPLLLLTTTGAKSGEPRTGPVSYLRDGERIVIVASAAGASTNPAWYHNLVANPRATVELGTDTFPVTATVLTGDERGRLFDLMLARLPRLAEYLAKTTREFPVVTLEPQP